MPILAIDLIKDYFLALQQRICQQFSLLEEGKALFLQDHWSKEKASTLSGSGLSCVLENGAVFEKVGVNFSHVTGTALPPTARANRAQLAKKPFEALGISLVTHPDNPYIPTSHANLRFFKTFDADENPLWWFGGGYDLTPYYGFEEDCVHWHTTAKKACDPFGIEVYPTLKRQCDEYFYIKHRQEPRGIGGLFFDDWNHWAFEKCFAFVQSIGDSYLPAYLPLVEKRKNIPFGEREKRFQKIRRGRYVEFNLVYDRGTLFGLQSGGRIESILMSLPKEVSWVYAYQPEANTPEAALSTSFLINREWL